MSISETIFTVFFAIFWGSIASVQGRWKMFHWTLFKYPKIRMRILVSFILLNILPILYFIILLRDLHIDPVVICPDWNFNQTFRLVIVSVTPAFAVFGFYRLWMAIIELKPKLFYYDKEDEMPLKVRKIDPLLNDKIVVLDKVWYWNMFFAIVYMCPGILVRIL